MLIHSLGTTYYLFNSLQLKCRVYSDDYKKQQVFFKVLSIEVLPLEEKKKNAVRQKLNGSI